MNEQEAIKIIKNEHCGRCDKKFPCNGCYIGMAIKAIEKQIAKKANKIIYSKHMDARMGICPACKSNEVYEWNVYCSKCGNKLDWTVEE